MGAFDRGLVRANRFLVGALLAVMAVLVFANVVLRYAFGVSLTWVEEVTRYMMIWLAWLASGLAFREGAHIAIDVVPEALPDGAARVVRIGILMILGAFFTAVAVLGWRYALFAWPQRTAVLRIPLGLVYFAIPIGAALMLAHMMLVAKRIVLHRPTAEEQAQAAEMTVL